MDRSGERPLGDLFGDLAGQLSELVRQEIELARVETTTRVTALARHSMLIGAGALVAYAGLLGLGTAIVLWLVDAGVEPWLAALAVAVAALIVGAILAYVGRSGLASVDLTPRATVGQLKEDAAWAKDRLP